MLTAAAAGKIRVRANYDVRVMLVASSWLSHKQGSGVCLLPEACRLSAEGLSCFLLHSYEFARTPAGVELEIPFQLASADRLRSPFTNYVRGYQGLLDYIW